MKSLSIAGAFGLVLALVSPAVAVPETVSFTARVTDNGSPANGALSVHIALFDAATGGTMVWEETQSLTADAGLVYATLGSTTALTPTVLDGRGLYAELTIEGDVLSPRISITSVPYAVRAAVADSVEGLDPAALQLKVTGTCATGSAIRQVNPDGTVVCETGTGGDITAVTTSGGITGGAASGAIALSIDTAVIQARVAGTCPVGSSIRAISATGTVTCETGATGDVTSVTTAPTSGLSGGNTTGDIALSVNTAVIQARVNGTCAVGSSIRAIAADGTVTCQTDAVGSTITSVTGGTGLTGGGTTGALTLSIATDGVTANEIAANAVGASEIAANAVTTAKIAADAVTTAKIATGAVTMTKTDAPIGYATSAASGSSYLYNGSVNFNELGSCLVSVQATIASTNTSATLRPRLENVSTNASVSQAEYSPSWYANGQYFSTATAVLTPTLTGAWRIGCDIQGAGTNAVSCRTSWVCN